MLMSLEIVGGDQFNEREWLRREVLWASIISPYDVQLETWQTDTAIQQHNGNFSRATLYYQLGSKDENTIDLESQSQAIFNQGKNIGGMLSSVSLFMLLQSSTAPSFEAGISKDILAGQTRGIDIALGNTALRAVTVSAETGTEPDLTAYKACQSLVLSACETSLGSYARTHQLRRAAQIMATLATKEVIYWRNLIGAYSEETHMLSIPNGGHPRSAGPRIEQRQPILNNIVASDAYRALT
jgi:hypothetical protein